MPFFGGSSSGSGSGQQLWQTFRQIAERFKLLESLQAIHRVYSFKQRFATIKIIGFNIAKVYKPIAAIVSLTSATYGYREWYKVRHSLQLTTTTTEEEMMHIFNQLDSDQNGTIESEELREALTKAGLEKSLFEVELMMRTADENHDGKISKTEWIAICKKISGQMNSEREEEEEEKADTEVIQKEGENVEERKADTSGQRLGVNEKDVVQPAVKSTSCDSNSNSDSCSSQNRDRLLLDANIAKNDAGQIR